MFERRLRLEDVSEFPSVEKTANARQDAPGQADPAGREKREREIAGKARNETPKEADCRQLFRPAGESAIDDGNAVTFAGLQPASCQPRVMHAYQSRTRDDALGGDAAVGTLEMRPDRLFFLSDRPEAGVTCLGRERQETAIDFSKCGGAEPGAGAEHETQAA